MLYTWITKLRLRVSMITWHSLRRTIDKKNVLSGFTLFLLGLFLAFGANQHTIWGSSGPESGFFPFVIAIIIMGTSLLVIGQSFSALTREQKKEENLEDNGKSVVRLFKVFSYVILTAFYGILIETVGFLITSLLFLILILKYVEKQKWKITILVGLATIIISYLLFVYCLGVPLPRGLIKWW